MRVAFDVFELERHGQKFHFCGPDPNNSVCRYLFWRMRPLGWYTPEFFRPYQEGLKPLRPL